MNCRLHGYVPGADTEHLVWVVTELDQALQSPVFLSLFGARRCSESTGGPKAGKMVGTVPSY